MTWGEVKRITLQKLFQPAERAGLPEEATGPLLQAMPAAANEGVMAILDAGKGCVKVLEVEVAEADAQHAPGEERDAVFDLAALAADFGRLCGDAVVYVDRQGYRHRGMAYGYEGESRVLLPRDKPGRWRLPYFAAPADFSQTTPDSETLLLPQGAAHLLPIFMAAALMKEEDPVLATLYRNEFEAALERFCPAAATADREGYYSEKNWV